MRSALAVFLPLVLLLTLLGQLNHVLSPGHIYLFGGGLFITFGALTLPLRPGLAGAIAAGLLCDANTPVPFGTHVLIFAAGHASIYHLRDRLPSDETTGRVAVALLANLGLFLAVGFVALSRSPAPGAIWPRLMTDLILSQLVVALATPWFFALQEQTLLRLGLPD